MYNEDQKKIYLEHLGTTSDAVLTYFNKLTDVEIELQKDVSCFNLPDIIGYYKSLNTTSVQYLAVLNSQLLKYTNWCLESGLVPNNQNEFQNIKRENLEECIHKPLFNKEWVTKEELLHIISSGKLKNACEDFLLLALFEGICGKRYEEIRHLYPSDFKGNTVWLYSGRKLDVSDKLIELAQESAEVKNYETNDGRVRIYADDERCFKFPKNTVESEDKEIFYIVRSLNKIKEKHEYYFAGSKELKESGRINMIKEIMKKNGWTAETAVREKREEIEYRYGRIMSIPVYLRENKDMLIE